MQPRYIILTVTSLLNAE